MGAYKSDRQVSPQAQGRLEGADPGPASWRLAEEIPVVLLYSGERFGVMMLTPADIEDFALGFSLTEGIVRSVDDISDIRVEPVGDGLAVNIIVPDKAVRLSQSRVRSVPGRSSCGLCGAQSLEAAMPAPPKCFGLMPNFGAVLQALRSLPEKQVMNTENHSTHAAALCGAEGNLLLVREDVGRHNALDKLCGGMARAGLGAREGFLILSSRFSVELAQKAASTGFCFVATLSAPTALSLKVAHQAGMKIATLNGAQLMVFEAEV